MVALLALVLVLFAAAVIASVKEPIFRIKGDIEAVLGQPPDNYCTGEPMDAHGDVVLLLYETAPGLAAHVNAAGAKLTGETSGTVYRLHIAYNEIISADDDGYHRVHHFSWVSPQPSCPTRRSIATVTLRLISTTSAAAASNHGDLRTADSHRWKQGALQ